MDFNHKNWKKLKNPISFKTEGWNKFKIEEWNKFKTEGWNKFKIEG